MKIKVFPAEFGDCFLVSIEDKNILIDCGFTSTYENFLRPQLKLIAQNGGLIDLLVITHLHSDHILGINKFLNENGSNKEPQIIHVKEIWFNGFKHIHLAERLKEDLDDYTRGILENLKEQGYLKEKDVRESNEKISEKEALTLTGLIIKNDYNWNSKFQGKAITSNDCPRVNLDNGTSFVLLSPTKQTLTDLDKLWLKYLKRKKSNIKITEDELFDQTFEFILTQEKREIVEKNKPISDTKINLQNLIYPFEEDSSIVNKSSIAFIIEYKDKKAMFLGDAHPTDIVNSMNILIERENYNLEFDFVKISHHGSEGNTSPELLNIISSKNYLISTNGNHPRHKHPDIQTIARILDKEDLEEKNLIFNYRVDNAFTAKALANKMNIIIPNEESIININL